MLGCRVGIIASSQEVPQPFVWDSTVAGTFKDVSNNPISTAGTQIRKWHDTSNNSGYILTAYPGFAYGYGSGYPSYTIDGLSIPYSANTTTVSTYQLPAKSPSTQRLNLWNATIFLVARCQTIVDQGDSFRAFGSYDPNGYTANSSSFDLSLNGRGMYDPPSGNQYQIGLRYYDNNNPPANVEKSLINAYSQPVSGRPMLLAFQMIKSGSSLIYKYISASAGNTVQTVNTGWNSVPSNVYCEITSISGLANNSASGGSYYYLSYYPYLMDDTAMLAEYNSLKTRFTAE